MNAKDAETVLETWFSKPQMIRIDGVRAFLESHGTTPEDIEEHIASESEHVRSRDGHDYVRRLPAVVHWPTLPWPSLCLHCEEILPKQCFVFINTKNRTLFPKTCSRCVHKANIKTPLSLLVDPSAQAATHAALTTCALYADTKPYIVKLDGLTELGLDVSRIDGSLIFPWQQCLWTKLKDARAVFGTGSPLPLLCTGALCTALNKDGVVKLQTEFYQTTAMAGSCKGCSKACGAASRDVASSSRSADTLKMCVSCKTEKPETSFEAGRNKCASCRNTGSSIAAAKRASVTPGMRKCTGCTRLLADDSPTNTCSGCREKGQRNDARPERQQYHKQQQQEHGSRYSRAYRKRQRDANPEEYLEKNAKRMREYTANNQEQIQQWRAQHPGTRIWSLRKHQADLEARGMPVPSDRALTDTDIKALIDGECFYCGASENVNGSILGVDRVDSRVNYVKGTPGTSEKSNCVASCTACNMSKGTVSAAEYVARAKWISCIGGDEHRIDATIWYDYEPSSWESYVVRMEKVGGDMDFATYQLLIQGPCVYCERKVPTGIDRVEDATGYFSGNRVSCCGGCNYAKRFEVDEAFLARMDAIAARHIEAPSLLEGICTTTNLRHMHTGGASSAASKSAPEMDCGTPALCMPADNATFWSSLDRRGAGKTTIFVRVQAIRPYVDSPALDEFVQGLEGNIRFVKELTYGETGEKETYVLMGRASKKFPDLPWPKTCAGPCGQDKPIQRFVGPATVCKDCGGSATARAIASGGSRESVLGSEAERLRKYRRGQGADARARDAARKKAARAKLAAAE
jgi:hypothetical protein